MDGIKLEIKVKYLTVLSSTLAVKSGPKVEVSKPQNAQPVPEILHLLPAMSLPISTNWEAILLGADYASRSSE